MKAKLKQLRAEHWAWLHAKFALFIWAALFLIFTPSKVQNVLGVALVAFVSLTVMIGIVISVVGLFVSFSRNRFHAHRGLSIELFGLWMAFSGPVAYMATQFFLALGPNGIERFALVALSYAIASLILVRIILVLRYQKRGN